MKAKTVQADGQTVLEVDGRRILEPAYTYNVGRCEKKHPRQVAESGLRIIFINTGGAWQTDGSFDTDRLNEALDTFSDAPSDLGLVVRFTITTPEDFEQKYPDELVRFAHVPENQTHHEEYRGGLRNKLPRFASFGSERWREAGCRYIDHVVEYVRDHPQGHRVIGYMINTGETAEAILWGFQQGLYGDFSDPGQGAFREWLRNRYEDEKTLQRAYGNPELTFDEVSPPSLVQRAEACYGELRHPRHDRHVIDYDTFQSDLVVNALIHWHRHARQKVGEDTLIGCFYGYCLWQTGMLNGITGKGHAALARLLESPAIDFVTGITTYWKRGPGEPGNYMLPAQSVSLHGKLHWNEDDLRTHVVLSRDNVWASPEAGVPTDADGSVNVYRRQFARKLTTNSQTWYYDIVGGMYDSEQILEEFGEQCRIAGELENADMSSCAEVACVVSEETALYHRQYHGNIHQYRDPVADLFCDRVTEGLYKTGVPLDWYLSSDLGEADLSQYRVIYFFNQVFASQGEREAIDRLKCDDRTLVFTWSPGFLSEDDVGSHLSTQLTGIDMGDQPLRGPARVRITDFSVPITQEMSTNGFLGADFVYSPLLQVEDDEAELFGHYEWNDAPAAACKQLSDWTSVVLGTSTAQHELLRGIFRQSGCTIRCETGDIVLENRSVLGLHFCHGGPVVLQLPSGYRGVRDLYSGNEFHVDQGRVHIGHVTKGETRIFRKLPHQGN